MIYWFTGQPGSGKTVLASALKIHLTNSFHVDGDDLRAIFDNKDYSQAGRLKNIDLAQKISNFLQNKGHDVVVSLVSPYREQREEFKKKMGEEIKEFHILTTEIRGRESFHVSDYEPPLENFVSVDTTNDSELETLNEILNNLKF
jgi:adenylylsulfate kinase-like enzyme